VEPRSEKEGSQSGSKEKAFQAGANEKTQKFEKKTRGAQEPEVQKLSAFQREEGRSRKARERRGVVNVKNKNRSPLD